MGFGSGASQWLVRSLRFRFVGLRGRSLFRKALLEQFEDRHLMTGIVGLSDEAVWFRADDSLVDARGSVTATLLGDTNYAAGRVGKAFNFDGLGDEVGVADVTKLNGTSVTYSFWFKASSGSGLSSILTRQFSDGRGWAIHLGNDGSLRLRVDTSAVTNSITSSGSNLRDGLWHFGTVTINDVTKSVSVAVDNGAPVIGTYTGNFANSGGSFRLGGGAFGTSNFAGQLDDIRVFDRVLSNAERTLLYASPGATRFSDQVGLEDTTFGVYTLSIFDPDTSSAALTVTAASSNSVVVAAGDITLGGSGSSRTVSIRPRTDAVGSSQITLTIGDGLNQYRETFTVTTTNVNDAPTGTDVSVSFPGDLVRGFSAGDFSVSANGDHGLNGWGWSG
jgi:hypothetical protein